MKRVLVTLLGALGVVVLIAGAFGFQNSLEFGLNQIRVTQFSVVGDRLLVAGILNEKSYQQFIEVYQENPQIRVLVLGEILGSIDDDVNIKLGYKIRELGLDTHLTVTSKIQSGGVDLFLAGVNRSIEPGAALGVHSWSDSTTDGAELPKNSPEHALTRDYIASMLGSDDFYWFTLYAAPSKSMYWMTDEDIQKYELLND